MSDAIVVMKRHELKYILTKDQVDYLKEKLIGHMEIDKYGLTSIVSLYYDTPDYRLIRTSIEKPKYKEKIRLRSYGLATNTSPIFLELKRKVEDVAYKRRIQTTVEIAKEFFNSKDNILKDSQIAREITYFRNYYQNLIPSCLIIYDRLAYFDPTSDLRLTLDGNPRYRFDNLNLTTSLEGISILPEGSAILEIKIQDTMPLWLSRILDEGHIKKGSLSKYGEAYKQKTHKVLERI